ncbi:hypothetical protein GPECTOR_80g142 [Gonium pectorale]|uniref:Piwi domain-containing protein n=1 Tax=Gonium pectorale TaxID=33097 RepID=A0A150G1N5_GONPE|nr:hypothetical protein GPECTOR_80g142 [Gonium pectorale]|eukprot:KXZ43782.1 hypothetical protein GPECTOR_80g142 [Gonium pectorale]
MWRSVRPRARAPRAPAAPAAPPPPAAPTGPDVHGEGGGEDLPPRLAHRIMMTLAQQHGWKAGAWRFDRPQEPLIPREVRDWTVKLAARAGEKSEREKVFTVTTKWAACVSLASLQDYLARKQQVSPRDAMQVLDIVIRHSFHLDPLCTVMGRGFYYGGDGVMPLGGGAEIWTGFSQSFKAVQSYSSHRTSPHRLTHAASSAAVAAGRNVKFHDPKPLDAWAVAVIMPQEDVDYDGESSVWTFLEDLSRGMISCGMRVANPVMAGSNDSPPVEFVGRGRGIEATMRAAADAAQAKYKRAAQLLLVILPDKLTEEYKEIKRVSDIELGIPSQVVAGTKAKIGYRTQGRKGGGPQYCANVAMKINSKLGGVNVTLSNGLKYLPVLGGAGAVPFIVMGADVTHPTGAAARNDARDPSVAAVVASLDQTLGRWATRVLLQAGRQEVITGMSTAVKELLLEFYRANRNVKPQRLVMYRDGVSEGQFDQVLAEEGNVVPGTVVDRGITAPDGFDFYLNSHSGLQGTNKPAHYHVLIDEIGFGADGIQLLTYWLCYLYQRTTKSVSYCPPAYYADRAAFRGRTLLAASSSASDSASEAGSTQAGAAQGGAGAPPTFAGIHRNLTNVLYFM